MTPARRNNWIPDIFNDFFDNNWMERTNTTAPAINVIETEKAYEMQVAAPGMTRDDFNVTLDKDGDLVIKMEKKGQEEKKENGHYLRREFSFAKFQQTMLLPDDAVRENISAKMENGVLTVNIPKEDRIKEENRNRMIEIQ